jgi:hypothetical protein
MILGPLLSQLHPGHTFIHLSKNHVNIILSRTPRSTPSGRFLPDFVFIYCFVGLAHHIVLSLIIHKMRSGKYRMWSSSLQTLRWYNENSIRCLIICHIRFCTVNFPYFLTCCFPILHTFFGMMGRGRRLIPPYPNNTRKKVRRKQSSFYNILYITYPDQNIMNIQRMDTIHKNRKLPTPSWLSW